jgi:hypothetical protein
MLLSIVSFNNDDESKRIKYLKIIIIIGLGSPWSSILDKKKLGHYLFIKFTHKF